jgi:hypothetical protein
MKITRFEDIDAWQEARKLVKMVYDVVKKSPKFRKDFRLVNQIPDAAVSAMSNIAGSAPWGVALKCITFTHWKAFLRNESI